MKEITKLFVNKYRIKKIGYDFMGYTFVSPTDLSYHHLIIEKVKGGEESLENGCVLVRKTAHDYIHIIERFDRDIFDKITKEIIIEKEYGININSIEIINDLLLFFEEKHKDDTFKGGSLIVRDCYKRRILTRDSEFENRYSNIA